MDAEHLFPEERLELALLLCKLEGKSADTISKHVVRHDVENADEDVKRTVREGKKAMTHHLEISSAANYGRPAAGTMSDEDQHDLDEVDEESHCNNFGDFFQ
jgi:hypothetical protein